MAESETDKSGTANFWLPSEFLTDDDFLEIPATKPTNGGLYAPNNSNKFSGGFPSRNNGGYADYFSPTSTLNSPGESVTSSAEAEEKAERDEFLAELTRQLARSSLGEKTGGQRLHSQQEKCWGSTVTTTSPQSTLSSGYYRSLDGLKSGGPPTQTRSGPFPFVSAYDSKQEALELLFAAAEEMARMKMRAEAHAQAEARAKVQAQAQAQARLLCQYQHLQHQQNQQSRGLLGVPCNASIAPCCHTHSPTCRIGLPSPQNMKSLQCKEEEGWFPQSQMQQQNRVNALDWPSLRVAQHQQQQAVHRNHHHGSTPLKPVFLGDSVPIVPKRQSTGTGVFLPRRYGNINNSVPPPRKDKGCPTVLLPARVVQALNLNVEGGIPNGRLFPESYIPTNHHDLLMARRNSAMIPSGGQQTRSLRAEAPMVNREALPQDWTY